MIIDGVTVVADAELTQQEIETVVGNEQKLWAEKHKELAAVELSLQNDNIVVKAWEKSPVRRVRRITGYLSNIENFNDAKQAELAHRQVHMA
ncbi:MAG: anaerobic ribonucleoside-triphosphate reductase [Sporomusaceae bacterium]|nr:anaerobic ribonucleoside-triphosphate reductase [Sporomusaceae bacterium]